MAYNAVKRRCEGLDKYCVLMSVYYKEIAEHLEAALMSMLDQTLLPSQIVLVADGPLTDQLEEVISRISSISDGLLEIIRLKSNSGLATALNTGLEHCRYEYVARMDSDDISLPDRCERQLRFMTRHGLDISSGTIEEFSDDPGEVETLKTLPLSQDAILRYAKTRNPFNHPCVMFRRSRITALGGYDNNYPFFEDYQLWVRLLRNGARCANIKKPLLRMRTGSGMFARRGGFRYLRCALKMEKYKLRCGFCSGFEHLSRISAMTVFCLTPAALREHLYKKLLRRKDVAKTGA